MDTDPADAPPFEMERLELVLLKRPAVRPEISEEEAERFQALHLAHFAAMVEAGHLLVAGPFDEQEDETLRGLCLYRTGSVARARALAESDPAVRNGRLEVEVMAFWCEKGAIRDPLA
jgi:uncharacterized protein YciI